MRTTCFLFAPLLACRTPGTPVPCKAGLPTGFPTRVCQQRPGPTTPDPGLQANPFSPFSRWFAISQFLCYFATPVQVARTHRITRRTIFVLPSFSFFVFFLFASRFHCVPIHTGNHAFSSRSPQTPHAYELSGISLLCPRTLTSAQALTAAPETVCIHTNTVHHSPPYLRLSSPKSRHVWYASHTEPTAIRLG